MSKTFKTAVINAFATALYIVLVSTFLFFGSENKIGAANVILVPITMLMLLVFSVSFVGFFIFGKPVLLYLDGKKKDAVRLFAYTLSIFFAITLLAVGSLVFFTGFY